MDRSRNPSKMKKAKTWVLNKFRQMRSALSCFPKHEDDAISEFDSDALAERDVDDLLDFDYDALAEQDVDDLSEFDPDALAERDVDDLSEFDSDALAEQDVDDLLDFDYDALAEFDADALAECDQNNPVVLDYLTEIGFKSAKEFLNEQRIVLDLVFSQESYTDQLIVDLLRLPSNESSEVESELIFILESQDIRDIIDAPRNQPTNEVSDVDDDLEFLQESQLVLTILLDDIDEELVFTQESYTDQLIVELLRLPSNESSEIDSDLVFILEISDIRDIIDGPRTVACSLPTNEASDIDYLDFVQESQL